MGKNWLIDFVIRLEDIAMETDDQETEKELQECIKSLVDKYL